MGRKRNERSSSASLEDNIIAVLATLLENKGVWDQGKDEGDSWTTMASSLERLASMIETLERSHTLADSSLTQHILLDMESVSQEITSTCHLFSNAGQELCTNLEYCQQLEQLVQNTEYVRLMILSAALSSSLRNGYIRQEHALYRIKQLSQDIYVNGGSAEESRALVEELRQLGSKMRNRFVDATSAPWKEAKDLLIAFGSRINSKSEGEVSGPDEEILIDTEPADEGPEQERPVVKYTPSDFESSENPIMSLVQSFVLSQENNFRCLVVGPKGSGKTHCLDMIERQFSSTLNVVRPSLPYDLLSETIGGAENNLISIFAYAKAGSVPSILLLDNLEEVCGSNSETSSLEPHVFLRIRGLLQSLLEQLRSWPGAPTLVICTSSEDWSTSFGSFDRILFLSNPTLEERKQLLMEHTKHPSLQLQNPSDKDDIDGMILNLSTCTSGYSFAEFTQRIRSALLEASGNGTGPVGFLKSFKVQVQQRVPESLRSGENSDSVDLSIFTHKDLVSPSGNHKVSKLELPLFGSKMEQAWNQIERHIIVPVCHAEALNRILYGNQEKRGKVFAGGVLLVGSPGCGKTALAYHCAAVASNMNPSVKLVDVSCTSLIHKEVGRSEQAIQRLFKTAKASAPCILLMDGIENVAAVRGNDNTTEGTMDRVLSTMLTELDGVDNEDSTGDHPACMAVIGIAQKAEWVDPALRRPGRLGCTIELGQPERDARARIVEREVSGTEVQGSQSIQTIAALVADQTSGFSGADVVAVCNEARVLASRNYLKSGSSDLLSLVHFQEALSSQSSRKNV